MYLPSEDAREVARHWHAPKHKPGVGPIIGSHIDIYQCWGTTSIKDLPLDRFLKHFQNRLCHIEMLASTLPSTVL